MLRSPERRMKNVDIVLQTMFQQISQTQLENVQDGLVFEIDSGFNLQMEGLPEVQCAFWSRKGRLFVRLLSFSKFYFHPHL